MLKNELYNEGGIFLNYNLNFTEKGKNVLKKINTDERMIHYNNLFCKTGDTRIKNFDFLKRFGTLHDFLIDLLNGKSRTFSAVKEQNEMIIKVEALKKIILRKEETWKERKDILVAQKSFKKCIKTAW